MILFSKIKKSFAKRIIFKILSYILLLFIVALSALFLFTAKILDRNIEEKVSLIDEVITKQFGAVFQEAESVAKSFATCYDETRYPTDSLYSFVTDIVKQNSEINGSAIAFEPNYFPQKGIYFAPYAYRKGELIKTKLLGNIDYDYFEMEWYNSPKNLEKSCWSNPYFDEGGGDVLMTTYSKPLYKKVAGENIFIGVLTIDISLEWLSETISGIEILESGYAFILSKDGTFVTFPDKSRIMNHTIFSFSEEKNIPVLHNVGEKMIARESGTERFTLDGNKYKIYYSPINNTGWTLAIILPEAEVYAPLYDLLKQLILIIIIGLTITIIIVYHIIKNQTKPLNKFADAALGIANGDFKKELPTIKSEDEMAIMRNSFVTMQNSLNEHIEQLTKTTMAKERIESELRIAREIQMGMIPKIFPPFPNRDDIDLYAILKPAKEVGGDLYDFFLIDDNTLCFAIGDVSGKGVPASLFMAVTRSLLRSITVKGVSTADIANKVNNTLTINNESSMFVTFFVGILNLETGDLQYSNAGHNPPVLIEKDGSVGYIENATNIPLGLFPDRNYISKYTKIKNGDGLFLYTDGVTEAENRDSVLYSEKRLIENLRKNRIANSKELINSIENDIYKHVGDYFQSDDLTMLCLFYNE